MIKTQSLAQIQEKEILYWREAEHESPESNSPINIFVKMKQSLDFYHCIHKYKEIFLNKKQKRVLELGGGQGWASALLKSINKQDEMTLTDISNYAIESRYKWEHIWNVKIDHAYPCKSYEIPAHDNSFDLIFCFSAAHHFVAHRRTFNELNRVLSPNGHAIYLFEPTSNMFFYKLAYSRVNNQKHTTNHEDLLIPKKIKKVAFECGFETTVDYYPSIQNRGPIATLYYYTLNKLPNLQKVLPCTVNFIFKKIN